MMGNVKFDSICELMDEFSNDYFHPAPCVNPSDNPENDSLERISSKLCLNDDVVSNEWEENVAPEMRVNGDVRIGGKDYGVVIVRTPEGGELRFYDWNELYNKCGIDAEKCLYQPTGHMGWKSPKAMGVYPVGVLRAFTDNGELDDPYGVGKFEGGTFKLYSRFAYVLIKLAKYWNYEE